MSLDPIRAHVTVRRSADDAFRVFTREMDTWWPMEVHSMAVDTFEGGVKPESIRFDEREGGTVVEIMSDGTEGVWATVLAWDPPHRFVLAWKPNLEDRSPTEIEVTFVPDGDETRVELEHRGWERLGDLAEKARSSYGDNWAGVLALYVAAAQRT